MTQNQSPLPAEAQNNINKQEPIVITPNKEELFDFPTAIKRLAEGKKISRKEWKNTEIYGEMKEERLIIHKEDGNHPWILSTGDLECKDWFVV